MTNSATLPIGPAGARKARQWLEELPEVQNISEAQQHALLFAASEWLINLEAHPAVLSPSAYVVVRERAGTLLLDISDSGSTFHHFEKHCPPKSGQVEPDESGMGLALTATLVEGLSYASTWRDGTFTNSFSLQFPRENPKLPLVLLIDDDPLMLETYGQYLADSYRLLYAETTVTALQLFHRAQPNLVLSDIHLSRGDTGLTLCNHLRQDKSLAPVPFVFLTGNQDLQTEEQAHKLAIDAYLEKPLRKASLLRSLSRVLENATFVRGRLGDRFDSELTNLLHPNLPPKLLGFESSVYWRSAEPGGGDLLFHQASEEQVLLVLVDLMGHGAKAKFYSQALAGYLSGLISAHNKPTPEGLLKALNRAFFAQPLLQQTMGTALVVVLDAEGKVEMAAAGHPEPYLLRNGYLEKVQLDGPLLGLDPAPAFLVQSVKLHLGDGLCLLTDGAIEIGQDAVTHANNKIRLEEMLAENWCLSAGDLVQKMSLFVDSFVSGDLRDDLTFVALKHTSP